MSNSKHDPDASMAELLARLGAARLRLDVRRTLIGAAWSALAGSGVVALLKVASLAQARPEVVSGAEWRWAGAVLAMGILLTATWVWRARADLLQMARRADRCFDLDDRLSTAVELGGRLDDRSSPVVAALFRDATARAVRVEPRRLVPIGIPGPAVAFALVAIGVLALELTSPASRAAPQPSASILAAAAEPDAASAAELILDIADLVREEADRESNGYLRVVATSLEQLAADVVQQGSGGQAVADELAGLLARAEAASSVSESDAALDGFSLTLAGIQAWLEATGERELVARADESTRESSTSEAPPAGPRSLAAAIMTRARAVFESARAERTGGESEVDPLGDELAAADSAGPVVPAEAMGGEAAGAPPMELSVSGERPLANRDLGGGFAIDDPSGGETPAQGPGGGLASLMAEGVEVPDVASSSDFELPTEGGSRRRLPEEIVPQTRFTEVAESALPRGDWRQTTQAQVTPGYLGISYREVASRYFLARIQQAEVEAESVEPIEP